MVPTPATGPNNIECDANPPNTPALDKSVASLYIIIKLIPRKRAKNDPTPIKAQEKQIISNIRFLSSLNVSLRQNPLLVTIIRAKIKYLCQGLNIELGDVINIWIGIKSINTKYIGSKLFVFIRQCKAYIIIIP